MSKVRLQPADHVAFQVVALANRIASSASRAFLRSYGVGVMEWRVLALAGLRPGTTANEISQVSSIDKASVSRAVQALSRRGYLQTAGDPADARRTRLTLTASGEDLHDRVLAASLARERLLLTGFSGAERQAVLELLRRMSANMALVEGHEPEA